MSTSLPYPGPANAAAAGAQERSERRERLAPGTAAGVTEDMIQALVRRFYTVVRADPILGPIFNPRVSDWDSHMAKLCDFWSSVTLMTGRFKGAPMAVHAAIPDIGAAHFAHWLGLWEAAVRAVCPEPAAALFLAKAGMIAESLQLGIAIQQGVSPADASIGAARTTPT